MPRYQDRPKGFRRVTEQPPVVGAVGLRRVGSGGPEAAGRSVWVRRSSCAVAVAFVACLPGSAVAATMPPTISTSFGAASIPLNGSTSLSFAIGNPNFGTRLRGDQVHR